MTISIDELERRLELVEGRPEGDFIIANTPVGLTAALITELEEHGFTKWQAREIVSAVAKGGKQLILASYAGNAVARITLQDLSSIITGPLTLTGAATFQSTATFQALVNFQAGIKAAIASIPYIAAALPAVEGVASWGLAAERSKIRVTSVLAGGSEVGGLGVGGQSLPDGQQIEILNLAPEPVKFLHEASEAGLIEKTPVEEVNRLILPKAEPITVLQGQRIAGDYDLVSKRFRLWRLY